MTGESVFISIADGFFSTDRVEANTVDKFVVKNNSTYTSIKEHSTEQFILYPSSTHTKVFNYRIDGTHADGKLADLYNLKGQLVASKAISGAAGAIDFSSSELQSGYYIIKIKTTRKEYSKMISIP